MFSLKTDSDSLLTSYVNKLLVVAIVLVLSVFVWLRPFTSVHNVAHAEVISDLPCIVKNIIFYLARLSSFHLILKT